jgi:hypothetical protein
MARYHHDIYARSKAPRYLVLFDLQWKVIEWQRLEASANLRGAMTTVIERLAGDGWQAESPPTFGFVFLNCGGARRLLILTERDPHDSGSQAFSPFK